jgi:hypothetical protein
MPAFEQTRKTSEGAVQAPVTSSRRGDIGIALDPRKRADLEVRLGADFSQVRIHADSAAAMAAREIDEAAFTVGNAIVFGAGRLPLPRLRVSSSSPMS